MFLKAIKAARSKLMVYYTRAVSTPVYIVATFCDPRCKMEWFDNAWKVKFPNWHSRVKDTIKDYYQHGSYGVGPRRTMETVDTDSHENFDWWQDIRNPDSSAQQPLHQPDELDVWMAEPRTNAFTQVAPLDYLQNNKDRFVGPTRMAFDVMSIPASSGEVERLFSR